MVRVVPRVPDGNISEDTAVRPQDVVRPGPHFPSVPKHPPYPLIPTPPALSWKEVFHAAVSILLNDLTILYSVTGINYVSV